ncbi:MAG: hypothetical protein IKE01_05750 [Clostridia bacterium]|nr:hypothetical protein [Clostridia bacterium]
MIKIKIIKTKSYTKDYRAKLKNKHMNREMILLEKIEQFLISSESMKDVMQDSLHIIYNMDRRENDGTFWRIFKRLS